jgi:glycosyltransferase involved in cell wall biosynthesis
LLRNRRIAIVIPAHDEERHVAGVIEAIPEFVDLVVVVDDGSRDGTADRVQRLHHPRLALLQHSENRGVGAAIVTGYRFALEHGADVVGVMGGDGQMEAAYLPTLLSPVIEGSCDFAKGNRFFSRNSWRSMPLSRVIGNVVLSLLTKPASGYWHIFDAQNGYTAISATMIRRLPLHRLETGYQFENVLLVHLGAAGAVVTDVPIAAVYGEEESGIKVWRDVPAILWALLTGFLMRIRQRYLRQRVSPLGALLISGALLVVGGIGTALWAWLREEPGWVTRVAAGELGLGGVLVGLFALMEILTSRRIRLRRPEHQGKEGEVQGDGSDVRG